MNAFKTLLALRKKHGRDRSLCREFPDLTVEHNVAPLGNRFDQTQGKREPNKPPKHLIVDTLHKQGPMVLSRADLPWAGGRKP
jgi:hypothetical protein